MANNLLWDKGNVMHHCCLRCYHVNSGY